MSNYDRLLEEAKKQGANLAKNYVPELYKILVEEEKLDPKDAGDRIKKDLALIWSLQTINKNLPEEAKHMEKSHEETEKDTKFVKPLSQIVIGQSTSGNSQSDEPVTDKPNNDEFGMGVVPMTEIKSKTHNFRIVMSAGKFRGLGKAMLKKEQDNGSDLNYAIEYDAKERALYVDVAEQGEAKDIDD